MHHLSSSSSLSSSARYSSSSSDDNINGVTSSSAAAKPLFPPKRVLVLRHGQALHNPRAEAARENGCSFDEFLRLMQEDDAFDAALTELGENQAIDVGRQAHVRLALRNVEMVVSSPLSRALKTADLAHPLPAGASKSEPRRVCIEYFREINGKLLNAQRRHRSELEQKFPDWCFRQIPTEDESWCPEELESTDDCSERGYRGLLWIMQQSEENVLLVCHGGLLSYTMNSNSKVVLVDGRKGQSEQQRCITKRFGNCELREFIVTVWDYDEFSSSEKNIAMGDVQKNGENTEPVITLEEVSMEMQSSYIVNDDGKDHNEEKVQIM
ncbi:hypothetical protein ACHAXR_009220 [Thalassiosira sp. AJA248-18]